MPLGVTTPEGLLSVPSLPEPGPIRLIAVTGSLAILAWLVCAALAARAGQRKEAQWSCVVLVLAGLTMIAGRVDAITHSVIQILTVAVALRNVINLRSALRWLMALGVLAWVTSAAVAMRTF